MKTVLLVLALVIAALAQTAPVNPDTLLCYGKDGNYRSCGSSGGGAAQCTNSVSFSPTPVFDFSICTQIKITLTGSVSPTILNGSQLAAFGVSRPQLFMSYGLTTYPSRMVAYIVPPSGSPSASNEIFSSSTTGALASQAVSLPTVMIGGSSLVFSLSGTGYPWPDLMACIVTYEN